MSWEQLPNFIPSALFPGGHLQTISSHLLKSPKISGEFAKWLVPLEDGDQLSCRYYPGSPQELVVFFHGLGGCVESNYMQFCGKVAIELGHSVVLVNHRGAGDGVEHARGIYHSGAVTDVSEVLRFARAKVPGARLTAVGFSLSANLLLNAAALLKKDLPDRIVAINPPIDLHMTSKRLLHPSNFVYDQKFVRDLKTAMADKFRAGRIDKLPALPRFCRLVDFDSIVTAPTAGFRSRDEYYTQCSSFHYAERIQTPSLILTAENDPFIPAEPFRKAKYPSHVKVKIEKHGGHVGYMGNKGRWLGEFIRAALKS